MRRSISGTATREGVYSGFTAMGSGFGLGGGRGLGERKIDATRFLRGVEMGGDVCHTGQMFLPEELTEGIETPRRWALAEAEGLSGPGGINQYNKDVPTVSGIQTAAEAPAPPCVP